MSIKRISILIKCLVILALISGDSSGAASNNDIELISKLTTTTTTTTTSATNNNSTRSSAPTRVSQGANLRPINNQQQQRRSSSNAATAAAAAANLLAVRQHWRQMERSLGLSFDSLGEQLKLQLNELLLLATNSSAGSSSSSSISSGCKLALNEVADRVRDGSLWASQMLDSNAKLPSGLLDGTLTEMGNFDGCLASRSPHSLIQGQYCTISIRPHLIARPRLHTACQRLPALSAASTVDLQRNASLFRWMSKNSHQFYYASLRLGICAPHKCSRTDLQLLLNTFLAKYELVGLVKSCQLASPSNLTGTKLDYFNQHFDFDQRIIICVLLTLIGLVLVGTLLDCLHPPESTTKTPTTSLQLMQRHHQPRRWQRYQVYQRNSLKNNKCNQCTHSALANNLALWTSGQQTKEDPLLSCPTIATTTATTPRQVSELIYGRCEEEEEEEQDADADDEEKDESWIAKLEQNHRLQQLEAADKSKRATERKFTTITLQVLRCFSLRQNLKTIGKQVPTATASTSEQQTSSNSSNNKMDDIKVIHGLRTLTMIWIVFGHTIGLVNPEMMNNLFALAQLSCSSRFLQALLNATLAVNTFFMISGVVTMISLVRRCKSASNLLTTTSATSLTAAAAATTTTDTEIAAKVAAAAATTDSKKQEITAANCGGEDSISIASSSQSSGASSNRRCIHLANNSNTINQAAFETSTTTLFSLPNDFKPVLWLLMRYLRLTPTYATVIGLSILMPALGEGPFWPETAGQLGAACKQNWYLNLAYLNNLLETDKLCLIHSWYLSNDWQFFLLTLCLLALAYKSKRLALLVAISLGLASMATTFAVTVVNEFPPTIVTTSPAVAERWQFIHQLYYKPWPHLNSYLIGLLVGYFIITRSNAPHEKLTNPRRWRLCCVALLFVCLASLLLSSIYPWNMGHRVDPILTGLHSATFRTLWATCCGWLVFTLVRNPRLWLAKFLSWPGFQLTSRLTYCTYLIHPLVIYYHFGTLRERMDSSMYGQFSRFLATLGLSYLMALLLSLLVESPSICLQNLLANLFGFARKQPGQQPQHEHRHRLHHHHHQRRHEESMCSSSGTESAVTSTTTDSWLISPPPRANEQISSNCQSQTPGLASASNPPLPPPPPPATTSALDAEFQRKLAQAIGRGFRIRSRMAANKSSASRLPSAGRPKIAKQQQQQQQPPIVIEPTSVGLIQNPLQRLQQHSASQPSLEQAARRMRGSSSESLQTFQQQQQQQSRSNQVKAGSSTNELAFDKQTKSLADNQQNNNNNNCSLNDLIQMRRKFLSQRSHTNM